MKFLVFFILALCLVPIISYEDSVPKLSSRYKRMVGGQSSTIEEFPYIVALETSEGPLFKCGGSILSPYFVITAAHCVEDESSGELQVRAGSSFRLRGGSIHQVRNYSIHPERYTHSKAYDLAILQLVEPIKIDKKTKRSISMFDYGEESKNGATAIVIGWGCIDANGTKSQQLKSLSMTILDKKECWLSLAKQRRICTSGLATDDQTHGICSGDSGSPLVIKGKLAGIVSSTNNGTHGQPINIFTEVSRYRNWIDKTTGATNLHHEENDENSAIKEFPYLVSVEVGKFNFFACGGAIISPWFIITAASCFDEGNDTTSRFHVRAGSSFEEEGGTRHRVRNVTIHPGYISNKEQNDLAVLLLEEPISLDKKTKSSISMFKSDEEIKNGATVKVAGWGCPVEDKVTLAQQLRNFNMTIISNNNCRKIFKNHDSRHVKGQDCIVNVLSGDNKTHGLCYDDAGNPLVIDGRLAGIVSRKGRSFDKKPSKFTEVASFRNWIDETAKELNATNNYFIRKKDEEDSAIKNFPYLVALEYSYNSQYKCGGAIISPYYVITAARCAGAKPKIYQVRVGSSFKEQGGVVHGISKFIFWKDLVLIRLEKSIELDNVTKRSIAMFQSNERSSNGSTATSAGWGCVNETKNNRKTLQSSNMKIIDKKTCEEIYKNEYFSFKEGQICAFIVNYSGNTCKEDSGNPLVIGGRLAGIKSYDYKTFDNKPSKFMEVAHYRNWIEEIMKT